MILRERATSVTCFFFFNDTATTEIYTLSLHDALPIYQPIFSQNRRRIRPILRWDGERRSEEHTSELQSRPHLVCRLLLEKTTGIATHPTLHTDSIRKYAHTYSRADYAFRGSRRRSS